MFSPPPQAARFDALKRRAAGPAPRRDLLAAIDQSALQEAYDAVHSMVIRREQQR